MRTLADIGEYLELSACGVSSQTRARELLAAGEEVLENWLVAHGEVPTDSCSEGFRLLALHRQAARGLPSFNACRETCRELVYHYNLVTADPDAACARTRADMMRYVLNHLYLFVSGKLVEAGLGDFCCSSRPLRADREHGDEERLAVI